MNKINYVELIDNLNLMNKDFADFKVNQQKQQEKKIEELLLMIQKQEIETRNVIDENMKNSLDELKETSLEILNKDLRKHELSLTKYEKLHKDSLAKFSGQLDTIIDKKLEDYKLRINEIDDSLELIIKDYKRKIVEFEMEKTKDLEIRFLRLKEREVEITTSFINLYQNIQSALTKGFLFDDIHKKIMTMETQLEVKYDFIMKMLIEKQK